MVQNHGVRRILDEWLHVKFQVNTFARGDSALCPVCGGRMVPRFFTLLKPVCKLCRDLASEKVLRNCDLASELSPELHAIQLHLRPRVGNELCKEEHPPRTRNLCLPSTYDHASKLSCARKGHPPRQPWPWRQSHGSLRECSQTSCLASAAGAARRDS